jgi:hypothetical protein
VREGGGWGFSLRSPSLSLSLSLSLLYARVIFAKQGFECCVSFCGGIVFFKKIKIYFCFKLMYFDVFDLL